MSDPMTEKRVRKCLSRIAGKKSLHDLTALWVLVDRDLVEMSGPSDDLKLTITEKGLRVLEKKAEGDSNGD